MLQESIAVHVRVIVYGQPVPINSANSTSIFPRQSSVAVTLAAVGIALHSTVTSFGTSTKTGSVVSSTVITWITESIFPQSSVATHFRVTKYGQPFPIVSVKTRSTPKSQLSFAITIAAVGIKEQSTVTSFGTFTKTGTSLSSTVIIWISVTVLLHESVAVHVRVIVYGQPVDIFSEKITATFGVQLSLAVTIAATGIELQSTVTSFGTFAKTGASLSSTVITWVSVTILLQESLAVHVRVIMYGQPVEISSEKTTVTSCVQLSFAVTLAVVGIDAQSTVTSSGTSTKVGKVLSSTVISWETIVWFPHESVAVQTLAIKYGQPIFRVSENSKSIFPKQLSLTVTFATFGIASHSTVTSPGTLAKTGATVSSTVITWITESLFSQSSVATHFRVIKYGQPVPISSVKTISTSVSQLSSAVTVAAAGIEAHSTVTSDGTFAKTGLVVSSTVITWITESAFWQSSTPIHFRVIV